VPAGAARASLPAVARGASREAGAFLAPDADALFSGLDLAGRRHVVIAVSGGSDSLALLILFRRFLQSAGSAVVPVAVTVDHGLRPESAAEAGRVAGIAARLGVAHRILTWEGAKPATGVAAAAREARHALLAQAAGEAGTDLVLTGHTLDDQAETLAMRQTRGGGRGEAGIAPATLHAWACWFVRPLLGARRAALRAFLSTLGQAWIDDPSNRNMAQERARTRAGLGDAEIVRLADAAAAAGRRRVALGQKAAAVIGGVARMPVPGLIRLDRAGLLQADDEAALYALRILLACTGGREQLPDAARAAAMLERIAGINFRATLSRSVIDARRQAVYLLRERRGLPAPRPLGPGLWDGRYRIGAGAGGLVAAGGHMAESPAAVPPPLAEAASATRPVRLLADGGRSFLDIADGPGPAAARPVVAPWARYLPCFDLAAADAAAALLGSAPVPLPPFRRHNDRSA